MFAASILAQDAGSVPSHRCSVRLQRDAQSEQVAASITCEALDGGAVRVAATKRLFELLHAAPSSSDGIGSDLQSSAAGKSQGVVFDLEELESSGGGDGSDDLRMAFMGSIDGNGADNGGLAHLQLYDSVVDGLQLSQSGPLLQCSDACASLSMQNVTFARLQAPSSASLHAPAYGAFRAVRLHSADLSGVTCTGIRGAHGWACLLLQFTAEETDQQDQPWLRIADSSFSDLAVSVDAAPDGQLLQPDTGQLLQPDAGPLLQPEFPLDLQTALQLTAAADLSAPDCGGCGSYGSVVMAPAAASSLQLPAAVRLDVLDTHWERSAGGCGAALAAVSPLAAVSMARSTVQDSTAAKCGGALFVVTSPSASASLDSTLLTGNIAASGGGGLFFLGSLSMVNITGGSVLNNNTVVGRGTQFPSSAVSNSTAVPRACGGGMVFAAKVGRLEVAGSSSVSFNTAGGSGGAVCAADSISNVVLHDDSNISNNTAASGSGGAIYVANGLALLNVTDGSSMSGNTAQQGGGGAVACTRNQQIRTAVNIASGSSVSYNVANLAGTGGGAILCPRLAKITVIGRSSLSYNKAAAGDGGAVSTALFNSILTLLVSDGSSVNGNSARSSGGAVYVTLDASSSAGPIDLTITNSSSMDGNTAGRNGGAVSDLAGFQAVRVLYSSTLSGNTAAMSGGALYTEKVVSEMWVGNGSAVERNTAGGNGGVLCADGLLKSYITGLSSVSTNLARQSGGVVYALRYVTFNIGNATISGNRAEQSGGVLAAVRRALANEDRKTIPVFIGNFIVERNAVVSGNAAGSDGGVLFFAISGLYNDTRPAYMGLVLSFNISDSLVEGNQAAGKGGVIAALHPRTVLQSDLSTTSVTSFSPIVISLTNSRFVRNTAGLDGQGVAADSGGGVVSVIAQQGLDPSYATYDKCALYSRGSRFEGNQALQGSGGALRTVQCLVRVDNSTFDGNWARVAGGAVAVAAPTALAGQAAVQAATGSLPSLQWWADIQNSVFSNNTAQLQGGALHVQPQLGFPGPAGILRLGSNTRLVNNSAPAGSGGALYVDEHATVRAEGASFKGNSASMLGGAALVAPGAMAVLNSATLHGNWVTRGSGGAVAAVGASFVSLTGSSLSGNSARLAGGGIFSYACPRLVIDGVAMSGNAAAAGGGVSLAGGKLPDVLSAALADAYGISSLLLRPQLAVISNTSISYNTAGYLETAVAITTTAAVDASSSIGSGSTVLVESRGGGIFVLGNASAVVNACSMFLNAGKLGSAVALDQRCHQAEQQQVFTGLPGQEQGAAEWLAAGSAQPNETYWANLQRAAASSCFVTVILGNTSLQLPAAGSSATGQSQADVPVWSQDPALSALQANCSLGDDSSASPTSDALGGLIDSALSAASASSRRSMDALVTARSAVIDALAGCITRSSTPALPVAMMRAAFSAPPRIVAVPAARMQLLSSLQLRQGSSSKLPREDQFAFDALQWSGAPLGEYPLLQLQPGAPFNLSVRLLDAYGDSVDYDAAAFEIKVSLLPKATSAQVAAAADDSTQLRGQASADDGGLVQRVQGGRAAWGLLMASEWPGMYNLTFTAAVTPPEAAALYQVEPLSLTVELLRCGTGELLSLENPGSQDHPWTSCRVCGQDTVGLWRDPRQPWDQYYASGRSNPISSMRADAEAMESQSACTICPNDARCPGGALMVPRPGYWHGRADSVAMHKCPNPVACGDKNDGSGPWADYKKLIQGKVDSSEMPPLLRNQPMDDKGRQPWLFPLLYNNSRSLALALCQQAWYASIPGGDAVLRAGCSGSGDGACASPKWHWERPCLLSWPRRKEVTADEIVYTSNSSAVSVSSTRLLLATNDTSVAGGNMTHPEDVSYVELQCAQGYTGTLCAACTPGYYCTPDFQCVRCSPLGRTITLGVLAFMASVVLVMFTVMANMREDYTAETDANNATVSDTLKVLIIHMQYFIIITRLNIDYPRMIADFQAVLSTITGAENMFAFSPSCIFPEDASADQAQVQIFTALLLPFVVVLVAALLWAARYRFLNSAIMRRSRQMTRQQLLSSSRNLMRALSATTENTDAFHGDPHRNFLLPDILIEVAEEQDPQDQPPQQQQPLRGTSAFMNATAAAAVDRAFSGPIACAAVAADNDTARDDGKAPPSCATQPSVSSTAAAAADALSGALSAPHDMRTPKPKRSPNSVRIVLPPGSQGGASDGSSASAPDANAPVYKPCASAPVRRTMALTRTTGSLGYTSAIPSVPSTSLSHRPTRMSVGGTSLTGSGGSAMSRTMQRAWTVVNRIPRTTSTVLRSSFSSMRPGRGSALVHVDQALPLVPQLGIVVMVAVFILYPTWVQATLSIFACYIISKGSGPETEADHGWWVRDMNQACYEGVHASLYLPVGIVCIIALCVAPPLVSLVLLWRTRWRKMRKARDKGTGLMAAVPVDPLFHDRHTRQVYGFLYVRYRQECWWWETVQQAQTFGLVAVEVFGRTLPTAHQALLLLALLLVIAFINSLVAPQKTPLLGMFEFTSLCVLGMTVTLGLYFAVDAEPVSSAAADAIAIIIIIINAAIVAAFAVLIARQLWPGIQRRAQSMRQKARSRRSASGAASRNASDEVPGFPRASSSQYMNSNVIAVMSAADPLQPLANDTIAAATVSVITEPALLASAASTSLATAPSQPV